MKTVLVTVLIAILGLAGKPVGAQQQPPTLETMLSDAGYVFNRYEELVTGVGCNDWNAPDSLKGTCKGELKAIGENVKFAKVVLAKVSSAKNYDLVALFEVYKELNEVAGHLFDLSANIPTFAQRDGVPYAQAGSKALTLAANMGNEIESRMVIQQPFLDSSPSPAWRCVCFRNRLNRSRPEECILEFGWWRTYGFVGIAWAAMTYLGYAI
jgi:hypothetical protein